MAPGVPDYRTHRRLGNSGVCAAIGPGRRVILAGRGVFAGLYGASLPEEDRVYRYPGRTPASLLHPLYNLEEYGQQRDVAAYPVRGVRHRRGSLHESKFYLFKRIRDNPIK